MQEFAEAQNRIHGGRIFSEARPVHISDHFRLKTPVVLVTVSCDIPASYVRAFTQLFDSHIPIYFDIILIPFTPRDQFEWDVQPCETFHDILPPSGIWRTESGGWTDGAATPDCAAPWRGMGCGL
ncbi:MAG: hypothetical protein MPK62_06310 [Alphaproteobacteria bacterium]|nr:hypothetical protein [Alphaproteobacteria bacterium]